MSLITPVLAGVFLAVIFHYSITSVQSAAIAPATTAESEQPLERSCSESNITIDQVQFQHVWDVNGLASYMTRLEQWKPFIDLETRDIRFKNGVIGGYWNFQIVRNLATGSRLTLCAVHTPDQRRPNPHDRNFFFEFKVLVTLVPPVEESAVTEAVTAVDMTSTTTPESIASPTTMEVAPAAEASPTPAAETTMTSTTATTTTTTGAPSSSAPSAPSDPTRIDFDEGSTDPFTNSIQQRSFGGAGFQRLMNATVASVPLMLQFTPLGLPSQHRLPPPVFTPMFMGREFGSASGSTSTSNMNPGQSSPSPSNVSLTSPTFQQSPISPKTHFTFWDFESKTLQLIRSKYGKGQQVPQGSKIVLTFTMTELIVEKPHTGRKTCA